MYKLSFYLQKKNMRETYGIVGSIPPPSSSLGKFTKSMNLFLSDVFLESTGSLIFVLVIEGNPISTLTWKEY